MYIGLLRVTRTGVPETLVTQERGERLLNFLLQGYEIVTQSFSESLVEDTLSDKISELDRM